MSATNQRVVEYIEELKKRVETLRGKENIEGPDDAMAMEVTADALELVIKELTDLLTIE